MRNKTEFCCKTEFCRNKKSMSAEKNPELCVLYMLGDITAGPASHGIGHLCVFQQEADYPQANYPKLIELLINCSNYSSNLLYEITGGKLGAPPLRGTDFTDTRVTEMTSVVQEFHSGFRAALKDLQGFHIFLLTLHQKLDSVLRVFLNITNKISGDCDRDDLVIPESPSHGIVHCPSPPSKERFLNDNHPELSDSDSQRIAQTPRSSSGNKESSDSSSPMSRESWHESFPRGVESPSSVSCV